MPKNLTKFCLDSVKENQNWKNKYLLTGRVQYSLVDSRYGDGIGMSMVGMGGRGAFMKMGSRAMYRIVDFYEPPHSKREPGNTFTSISLWSQWQSQSHCDVRMGPNSFV